VDSEIMESKKPLRGLKHNPPSIIKIIPGINSTILPIDNNKKTISEKNPFPSMMLLI